MMAEGQWKQVAQRVFQRRYDPLDITVGAVLGEHGLTVIDTRNNACEAQEIIDDVSARFGLPIVAVINTHAHYDHTFGNQLFAQHSIPIYGHHLIPAHFEEYEKPRLEKVQRSPEAEPEMDWDGVVLTPPTHLLAQPCTLNLGGREVELIPLDAGHTDTDLAIHIPDANTWFLGDIIEQSGPPMFGSGAYPLDWPIVLESLLERIQPGDIIVPGHGEPVDRDFVVRQLHCFQLLATTLRDAHQRDESIEQISFSAQLKDLWPEDFLMQAATDAYAQLPGTEPDPR
ncbi:MBL fold metallo-hydrolase [Glutamicibacter arilaitensis]|jgi:glyoxylase-like metal-dependent hydrolase (beta-lactamase superfamily II)|uniref:MBL fold metallo-hydrolase n=2 Tax=Glutamicibacter arilaitensis TaxID=256701 RepID=UPI003F91C593